MDWDLDELIRRIRAGDVAAENELCRLVYPRLIRKARAMVSDAGMEGPEDAVVVALGKFIDFVKRTPVFDRPVLPYLMGVLHNACLDILKRRRAMERLIGKATQRGGGGEPRPPQLPDVPFDLLHREILKLKWPCPLLLISIYYYDIPTKVLAALLLGRPVTLQAIFKRRDNCLKELYRRLNLDL